MMSTTMLFCIAFQGRTNKILPFQKVEICQFYL